MNRKAFKRLWPIADEFSDATTKLGLKVTKAHSNKGVPLDCFNCTFNLAGRELGRFDDCCSTLSGFYGLQGRKVTFWAWGDGARAQITAVEQGGKVTPGTYVLIPPSQSEARETQENLALRLLRAAGSAGVSKRDFVYKYHIPQIGRLISNLQDEGFSIETLYKGETDRWVTIVLKREPGRRIHRIKKPRRTVRAHRGHPKHPHRPRLGSKEWYIAAEKQRKLRAA